MNTTDHQLLLQALSQATITKGQCAPNPAVGAIITTPTGNILAQGHHTAPGCPHAEIEALTQTSNTQNATLYVTLEPCCHWGKTPPCTNAIIQAGITRVVYAYQDPNPLVHGTGIQQLQDHGITCDFIPLPEISNFYASYQHWSNTQTPFITAKIAMTLDGKIAGPNGERILITGEPLQELTHLYRKQTDAILTTAKTIINDNPQLNVRYQNQVIPKHLYVLDSQLSTPITAKIFATTKSVTFFHSQKAAEKKQSQLQSLGARCISVAENEEGLCLTEVTQKVGKDGIHDLWIEAGGKCFSAFLHNQLIHRALIYLSPKWLNQGLSAFNTPVDFSSAITSSCRQLGKEFILAFDFHR